MHWLVSQSIFLVRITVLDSRGNEVPSVSISTCGYSPMAIIFVAVLGCILVLFGAGTGMRRYRVAVPLAGSCSAVISAACHPPEGSIDTTLRSVMWQAVDQNGSGAEESAVDHYSFS